MLINWLTSPRSVQFNHTLRGAHLTIYGTDAPTLQHSEKSLREIQEQAHVNICIAKAIMCTYPRSFRDNRHVKGLILHHSNHAVLALHGKRRRTPLDEVIVTFMRSYSLANHFVKPMYSYMFTYTNVSMGMHMIFVEMTIHIA